MHLIDFSLIVQLTLFIVNIARCQTQHNIPISLHNRSEPKIVGGELAKLSENKHMVSIRLIYGDNNFGKGHICGGSLISDFKVLTAAHCFLDLSLGTMRRASDFKVVMGTLDRESQTTKTQVFYAAKIIPHKSFSITTMENDIGLIILKKPVQFSDVVEPINMSNNTIKYGTSCRVDGWGAIRSGGPSSRLLMSVNLTIISHLQCSASYGDALKKGMFCASTPWKDSCQGDSGGPFVCNGTLCGVVSWGKGCADPMYPGIYTDVSYYKDWISTNAANKIILNAIIMSVFCFLAIKI